jgi:ABC-type Co2+ transport system permease subunit
VAGLGAFNHRAQAVRIGGCLLGRVLAAEQLSPWAGAVCVAAVLIVQSLLFADSGLTAPRSRWA